MTSYDVYVTREDRLWAVQIPDIDGVVLQVRRLSDVEESVQSFIAKTLDVAPGSVEVLVGGIEVGGVDITYNTYKITALREQAAVAEQEALVRCRIMARSLAEQGVPVRDIGAALGVSHQRAHQLITEAQQTEAV